MSSDFDILMLKLPPISIEQPVGVSTIISYKNTLLLQENLSGTPNNFSFVWSCSYFSKSLLCLDYILYGIEYTDEIDNELEGRVPHSCGSTSPVTILDAKYFFNTCPVPHVMTKSPSV